MVVKIQTIFLLMPIPDNILKTRAKKGWHYVKSHLSLILCSLATEGSQEFPPLKNSH